MTTHFMVDEWMHVTDRLSRYFANKYFNNAEYYWVADEIGGVFCIADYFFSINEMVDFLEYKYSAKMMFEYYDYRLANYGEEFTICIRDYKKLRPRA